MHWYVLPLSEHVAQAEVAFLVHVGSGGGPLSARAVVTKIAVEMTISETETAMSVPGATERIHCVRMVFFLPQDEQRANTPERPEFRKSPLLHLSCRVIATIEG
jgi:hypothetical protein